MTAFLARLVLMVSVLASVASPLPAHAGEDVKIGLLFDVTGPVANFVPPMLDAAGLAVDQVNAQGGILDGRKLVTVLADTHGTANGAVAAADKLVRSEHVPVVVGPLLAGTTLASALSVIGPAGVAQISPTASTPALTALRDNDRVFRLVPSDAYQGPVLARLLISKGLRRVALTYADNDYTVAIADAFRAAYLRLGGKLAADLKHEENRPTYGAELAILARGKPQALVLIAFAAAGGITMVKEALAGGFFTRFIGPDSLRDDLLIEQVGAEKLKTALFTAPASPPASPSAEKFETAYAAAYQTTENKLYVQQAYDATFLAALAIEKAGSLDHGRIRDALRGLCAPGGAVIGPADWERAVSVIKARKRITYQAASGDCNFDRNGDVAGVIGEFVVEDGHYKQVGLIGP
jgi:branched-chain amino acid transport system substrate-binding protein